MENNLPKDQDKDINSDPILPRLAWGDRRDWIKQLLVDKNEKSTGGSREKNVAK